MFGEDVSESPRQASPWLALSNSSTPELRPSSIRRSSSSLSRSQRSDSSFELFTLDTRHASLSPEEDLVGHIEYKLKLPNSTPERLQKLVTQLKWRLLEGGGRAVYEIGVRDDGAILGLLAEELDESLATLEKMAKSLGARCEVLREIMLITGDEEGEDEEERGPAPDNPLLARPRNRCIAEPSLDPTPELSDSDQEEITSALGELARLGLHDTDEELDTPLDASMSSSTAAVLDELPPTVLDPPQTDAVEVSDPADTGSIEPSSPLTPPASAPAWTAWQIEKRKKKFARRHASRARRAAGLPPKPEAVAAPRQKRVKATLSSEKGQRYAAEVLVQLDEGGPSFLSFEDAFV